MPLLDPWGTSAMRDQRYQRLLSITLACGYYPSPLRAVRCQKVRLRTRHYHYYPSPLRAIRNRANERNGRTDEEQARSQQSRGSTLLSIALLAGTKERRRAAAQVPFFTTLVTALLATRHIILFYLCKTKATRKVAAIFLPHPPATILSTHSARRCLFFPQR